MTTPTASSPDAAEPLRYPDHKHLPSEPDAPARPYKPLPTHKDLPEKDGEFVRDTQEPYQSALLEESLRPVLSRLHPQGDFLIGKDTGLYWRITDPPLRGCKAPDWFLVRGVPALLDGEMRRSYVLWQEKVAPLVILEYATDGTAQEHDRTPWEGKFWVYEQIVHPTVYGIFEWDTGVLEVFHATEGGLTPMPANEHGRYPIPSLGVELGVWRGNHCDFDVPWLRWWDAEGKMLPSLEEVAERLQEKVEQERQQVMEARQQAEESRLQAERLAAKLRALGVDPNLL